MGSGSRTGSRLTVELAGLSGSGKSSGARAACARLLDEGRAAWSTHAEAFRYCGIRLGPRPRLQNLLVEAISTSQLALSRDLRRGVRSDARALAEGGHRLNGREVAAILRGSLRHRAVLELARARRRSIVIDEGTLQTLHSLVGTTSRVRPRQMAERYLDSVPLCDVILFLDSDVEDCLARALERPDPPFPWGEERLAGFLERAHEGFAAALGHPRVRSRVRVLRSREEVGEALMHIFNQEAG